MPATSNWDPAEDEKLKKLIDTHGAKKWSLIASLLGTKGSKQCRRRWKNYLNADLKKGGWSKEEDQVLIDGHRVHGNKWTEIAKLVGGRTDNAVKNRWAALCKRSDKLCREPGSSGAGRRGGGAGVRKAGVAAGRGGGRKQWSDEDSEEEDEEEDNSGCVSPSCESADDMHQQHHIKQEVSTQQVHQQYSQHGPRFGAHGSAADVSNGMSRNHRDIAPFSGVNRGVISTSAHAPSPPMSRLNPFFHISMQQQQQQQQQQQEQEQDELLIIGVGFPNGQGYDQSQASVSQREHQQGAHHHHRHQGTVVLDLKMESSQIPSHAGSKRKPSALNVEDISANGGGGGSSPTDRRQQQQHQLQQPSAKRQALEPGAAQLIGRTPRTPNTPLMIALAQEAAARQQASQAKKGGVSSHMGVGKKPMGLSISIPHAPDGDPHPTGPPSTSNYLIQVFRDCLTPSEQQFANEINEMALPLHIHISDEPPLTSCRREIQKTMFALNNDEPGIDCIDSPGEWLPLFYADMAQRLSPPLPDAARLAPTPARLTRSASRGNTMPTPDANGRRLQRTPLSRGTGDSMPSAKGGPSSDLPDGLLTGRLDSPATRLLMGSLTGLQDGHKQLLNKLLTGVKVTEEGLLTQRGAAGKAHGFGGSSSSHSAFTLAAPHSPNKPLPAAAAAAAPHRLDRAESMPFGAQASHAQAAPGSPHLLPLDVLMMPQLPLDELDNMLEFLDSMETPRL